MELDSRIVAWILYSVDLAAGKAPASLTDISSAADSINHAVPTQQELSRSLRWLQAHSLIESHGKFYSLSELGHSLVGRTREHASTVSSVLAHLSEGIQRISAGA